MESSNTINFHNLNNDTPKEQQYGIIYDLVSEGEIEGLVKGHASVYLNDTPLANSSTLATTGARQGKVSKGPPNDTTLFDANGLFEGIDLSDGDRYVQIRNADFRVLLNGALSPGDTQVTVNSPTFNAAQTMPAISGVFGNGTVIRNVRIPGAGPDGTEYSGSIVQINSTTQAELVPAISTAVPTATPFFIDYIGKITSITDDDTAVVQNAPGRDFTNAVIQVFPALTTTSQYNFSNSQAVFRVGSLSQPTIGQFSQAPTASFIAELNRDLLWSNDSFSGTNPGGTTGPVVIQPTADLGLTAAQKGEIDNVRLTIEFPTGLIYAQKDGDLKQGFVEFQIAVEYSRDGTNYEEELVVGRANPPSAWTARRGGAPSAYPPGIPGIVYGRTRGTFYVEYNIPIERFQPLTDWRIRVYRITPEDSDDFNGNFNTETFSGLAKLRSVEAQVLDRFTYPNSAYSAVTFNAKDFSTPPARGYHIRGKKVKVPSNYITREELDPANPNSQAAKYTRNITTGVDEGTYQSWDGSFRGDQTLSVSHPNFRKVYTNNPAWVFYDILTNRDYGLGDFLSEDDIDIYSLYQVARYCDELVSDGKGGLEPRFACNVYISSAQEAYKVLKDLASSFRGMMYWIDGQITAVQDRPKEPVYTFTQGNVIDGLFSYEYTGQRSRINQVNVTWNDPEQLYRQTVVTVDDIDNIVEQNRIISKDVVAFGCTSEGQATRVGRWHLLTDTQETEIVKFQTSINAGFLRPGDWIKIQDAKADNIEFSGRVSTGSTATSIELDREVTLQSGQSYVLYLIYPKPGCYLQQASATIDGVSYVRGDLILADHNGNSIETSEDAANIEDDSGNSVFTSFSKNSRLEKKSVSSSAGDTSTLTVSSGFSSAPAQDTIWAVSNINEQRLDAPVTYRILGISEDALNLYSIVGAKVVTEKFDELEKKWAVYVDPYKPTPSKDAEVPAPTSVKFDIVPAPGVDADTEGAGLQAVVSWNEPLETIVDSNGNSRQVKYRFLDSYELQHNFKNPSSDNSFTTIPLSAASNSFVFENIGGGEITVRIRARNSSGQRSRWVTLTRTAAPTQIPAPTFDRLSKIVLGGQINSPIAFNTSTGLIEISNSNYLFVSSIGKRYDVVEATTAQSDIDFSSLSSGDTGYWYFDFSDTSDPWKTMIEHTDTTVENTSGTTTNFSYWKELGASNNGLTLATGTVSLAAGSDEITGASTSFTTDFAVGDLIKLSTNNTYTEEADAEYFEVAFVESDTKLFVRRNATKTFSGDYAYKQSFKPDFINDNILASVTNTAGTFSISYFVLKSGEAGADGAQGVDGLTIVPTNATHAFLQALDGTIDYTSYSCEFDVAQGDTAFTYDGSGTPAADTFSLAIDQQTNITASIDGSGVVTVSNMTDTTAEVAIEVTINDTSAVFREILTFVLVEQAVRGSGTFTFEESTTSDIAATDVQGWVEDIAFTNTHAQNVADAVIAASSDGFIRPNDKITVTDNSADLAGTRVYTGSAQASSGSIQTSNFSSLIVETFDGSVIVDGTLSAEKLLADSTFTQNLVVGASFEINSSGKIYSTGKNTFADTDAGFFLGYDGGDYKFNIGNSSNFLKWDGTELSIQGTLRAQDIVGNVSESFLFWTADELEETSASVILIESTIPAPNGGISKTPVFNFSTTVESRSVNDDTVLSVQLFVKSESATGPLLGNIAVVENGYGEADGSIVFKWYGISGNHLDILGVGGEIGTSSVGANASEIQGVKYDGTYTYVLVDTDADQAYSIGNTLYYSWSGFSSVGTLFRVAEVNEYLPADQSLPDANMTLFAFGPKTTTGKEFRITLADVNAGNYRHKLTTGSGGYIA